MTVKLSVYGSSTIQCEFNPDEFPVMIGRAEDVDICLCDRWVSRCHCELSWQDGVLLVRDLDSKHGTMLNDERITTSTMLPGDRLGVGLSSIVAEYSRSHAVIG